MEQGGSEARQMGCQRQHLNPHQKSALVDTPLLNWGKREIGRRLHTTQLRTHLSLPWALSRPDGLNFKTRELLSGVRFSAPRSSIKGFITTLILVLNHRRIDKMEHDETGCQAAPEGPILCINNCGFFGSSATMNMCSKCHKDMMLKQDQAKLAETSIGNIVNRSSSSTILSEPVAATIDAKLNISEPLIAPAKVSSEVVENIEPKPKEGPTRCSSCKKRVGLTGFKCRCGDTFCGTHRYSDKHECPFDYRTAARDAIAKANPLVKAEKLDKI